MATVVRTHVFCDVHLRDGQEADAVEVTISATGGSIPAELAGHYTVDLCPKCDPQLTPALTQLLTFAAEYGRRERDGNGARPKRSTPRRVNGAGTRELPPPTPKELPAATNGKATNGKATNGKATGERALACQEPGCSATFTGQHASQARGAHTYQKHRRDRKAEAARKRNAKPAVKRTSKPTATRKAKSKAAAKAA